MDLARLIKSAFAWFVLSTILYVIVAVVSVAGLDAGLGQAAKGALAEAKSLLSNVLASFLLYYLVGYLPARRKHLILRASCRKMYLALKEDILFQILSGAWNGGNRDVNMSLDERDRLMSPAEFRELFEGGREANEGFYAFTNHMQRNEDDFRLIVSRFKSVARQIEFVLNNMEIVEQEKFDQLKRIEQSLLDLDDLHASYDDVKVLDRVIWEIFAGWSSIDGFRGYDPVLKAIDEL